MSIVVLVVGQVNWAAASMCQHHQAMLEAMATPAGVAGSTAAPQQQQQQQSLIVCPKSSQFNNLPQFPSPRHLTPHLERQQRELLKTLNASFVAHLQSLAGHNMDYDDQSAAAGAEQPVAGSAPASANVLPTDLIDDDLLNELISPVLVDAAYERAKELIVKRRKLENELVKQGEFPFQCLTCWLIRLPATIN